MLVTHTVDTRSMAKGERFDFWHELLAREVHRPGSTAITPATSAPGFG